MLTINCCLSIYIGISDTVVWKLYHIYETSQPEFLADILFSTFHKTAAASATNAKPSVWQNPTTCNALMSQTWSFFSFELQTSGDAR